MYLHTNYLPPISSMSSHDHTFLGCLLRLRLRAGAEYSAVLSLARRRARTASDIPDRLVKNALKVPLRERGALEVLLRPDLLGYHNGLFILYRRHLLLSQAFFGCLVIPQVELGADEDDGHAGRMMIDLRVPLRSLAICIQGGASGLPWP
jgi:hypothetical protein